MKILVKNDEKARLKELYQYQILDTEPEKAFDDLARLAASICRTPIALINLVDENRQWFKARVGLDMREVPREIGLCPSCVEQREIVVIPDALADRQFATNPVVTFYPYIRFYAGVPLMTTEGNIVGTLCVADRVPREISAEQLEALLALSRQVVSQLELRRNLAALACAIAERKQMEEERKDGEARLRLALEAAHMGTWDWDILTNKVVYSDNLGPIFGIAQGRYHPSYEAFLGAVHPDDRQRVAQAVTCAVEKGADYELEFRVLWPDGTTHWVGNKGQVYCDQTGKPTRMLGVAMDITDRERSEEALQSSIKALTDIKFALDQSAIVAITDRQGRINYINDKFCEISKYSQAELLGQNHSIINSGHHPQEFFKQMWATISSGQVWKGEIKNRAKDGTFYWVDTTIVPLLNAKGKPNEYVAIRSDITERKRAQEQIKEQATLLDQSQDAIFVLDAAKSATTTATENYILFWNKSAERLFGWTAKEAIAANAEELLFKKAPLQLKECLQAVAQQGEWHGELLQVTKNNKEIIIESRWTLVRDEQEQAKSILVVNTDITEKKHLQTQFLRAQRLESIGTLAGGIAHDLNNILTPILAASQLLQLKLPNIDTRSQHLLQTLENSARRGAALVKQVLSFARGIEGQRTLLQVRHLITEIKQIAKETFPKYIEFSTDIQPDLWLVSGDATQLHQVLMNLVINARDAIASGGALSITAQNVCIDQNYARMHLDAAVGPYIMISVADNGIGMPSEIVDRIFEPFFTTKEPGKGTGLGLSTALGIVKSHGGFVNVVSTVGQGTQFQVFLPAVEAEEAQQLEDSKLPKGNRELILIVDDEAAIRDTAKTTLEAYNYQVITASDGIEAISLYAQFKDDISVALVDIMMPSLDGVITIRTLRKMNPNLKTIAVSGLTTNNQPAQAVGANIFLSKPYTTKDLLQNLHSLLLSSASS